MNDRHKNPSITTWAMPHQRLGVETCARLGIEALLGVLIGEDAFGWAEMTDHELSLCAEFYYARAREQSDFIGVYLRTVSYMIIVDGRLVPANDEDVVGRRDLCYPRIGSAEMKMVIQPVTDETVLARWNRVDRSRLEESAHGLGMISNDANLKQERCRPLKVESVPPQHDDDVAMPRFLIAHYDEEWAVARAVRSSGDDYLEESYIPIFPGYDPGSATHFRLEEVDGKSMMRWVRGASIDPIRQPVDSGTDHGRSAS